MYLAFKGIDFEKLLSELKKTNYFYAIGGSLIGVVIGSYIRALRWKYFLDPLKKDIQIKNLFSAIMVGYMMNAVIPRSGEVSRPLLLAKKESLSRAATFGTIIAERIIDVLTMLIMFGVCLFLYREKISDAFGEYDIVSIAIYASIAILVIVIGIIIMILNLEKTEVFIGKLTMKFLPKKYNVKIHEIFIKLINGFLFIKYPKEYLKIFVLSILIWGSYVLSAFVTMFAFKIDLNFLDANLVQTMMAFAMMIPLPGNSAGSFHFFGKTVLVSIFGINPELAIGYVTVLHLLGLISLLIIGFYFSMKENFKFNQKLNE
jgi:uncharacterized protein (TIRG00374 family)